MRTEAHARGGHPGIEVMQFIQIVKRRWLSIGLGVAGAVALGVVYLHVAQPLYTSELLVSPTSREGTSPAAGLSSIADFAGISLSSQGQPNFSAYMEGLRSRQLADLLAQDQNLMQQIYRDAWDEETGTFAPPSGFRYTVVKAIKGALGYPETGWASPSGADLHEFLKEELAITPNDESGFLALSIKTADPALGREILQKAHFTLDNYIRQQRATSGKAYVDYLSKRLAAVQVGDYREALLSVLAQQEKSLMLASDPNAYAAEAFGPAYSSKRPTSPKPIPTLLAAIVAGLMAGVAWALMRETSSQRSGS